MNSGLVRIAHGIGGLLVFAGAAFQFFEFDFAKYVFAAGAAVLLVVQAIYLSQARDADIRTQRMARIMLLVTFVLAFGAYLMFTGDDRWVILVLLYALVSAFLAWRAGSSQEGNKSNKGTKNN